MVVISVAKGSDHHYILPRISLPRSDIHYSFITDRSDCSYNSSHIIIIIKIIVVRLSVLEGQWKRFHLDTQGPVSLAIEQEIYNPWECQSSH